MATTLKHTRSISELLKTVPVDDFFQPIQRIPVLPYDINIALDVVEALGRERKQSFILDEDNRFVYENLIRWVHADPAFMAIDPVTRRRRTGDLTKGIYIAGNTGTGKTWALDIMRTYLAIDSVRIKVSGIVRPLKWGIYRSDSICDEYASTGDLSKFKNLRHLCIHDLGAEPLQSVYMGNRVNVLQQIIENRGDRVDYLTLFTSNYPLAGAQITSNYGERAQNRLYEMCNYFELTGKDRRRV
jgi:hypothetical protein